MADIQHKDITDPEIHEPKGITSAPPGLVYLSSGTGTGSWGRYAAEDLKNNTVDFSSPNQKLIVNSSGGIGSVPEYVVGTLWQSTGDTGDTYTLPGGQEGFLVTGTQWTQYYTSNIGYTSAGRLTITTTGLYSFSANGVILGSNSGASPSSDLTLTPYNTFVRVSNNYFVPIYRSLVLTSGDFIDLFVKAGSGPLDRNWRGTDSLQFQINMLSRG